MSKILIADDEHAICAAFAQLFEREGHAALIASNGKQALEIAETEQPDLMFLDVQMPEPDGLAVLRQLKQTRPELPVILITAHGSMDTAMQAMQLGAFDYLGKPVELPRVRELLRRALASAASTPPLAEEQPPSQLEPPRLIGQSAVMQEVFKLMGLLTTNDLTVLITGESGVGKELVARGIHDHSQRHDQPFMAVNCAAIPDNLLEGELFGSERGAYTSANQRRIGRFEAAGQGTLLLDEIAEMPLSLQSKLLRVLQEQSFERLGSHAAQPLHARLITATNRDLEEEVAAGRFREDLYHRLHLVRLDVPPLRRRKEDIPLLADYFLKRTNQELGKQLQPFGPDALKRLKSHHWPGNVRELEHVIKRSALRLPSGSLTAADLDLSESQLPGSPSNETLRLQKIARRALHEQLNQERDQPSESLFHDLVGKVEVALIDEALNHQDGNQVAASKMLGINRTTLRKKMGLDGGSKE